MLIEESDEQFQTLWTNTACGINCNLDLLQHVITILNIHGFMSWDGHYGLRLRLWDYKVLNVCDKWF
jgi:hypothetical protein